MYLAKDWIPEPEGNKSGPRSARTKARASFRVQLTLFLAQGLQQGAIGPHGSPKTPECNPTNCSRWAQWPPQRRWLYSFALTYPCYITLYCAKGNYEFGISRVIKSLEPYNKKLGTDTWFYAKRCFLSLIENLAKHMISVRDSVIQECIQVAIIKY